MTSFWSAYIIVLTLITLIGTAWLLFGNRTRPADSPVTTGHVADGIEEYDNPLPAWWMHLFVITLVFAIGYLIAYPGLGSFPGVLGWTQIEQLERENQRALEKYEPIFASYRELGVEEVAADVQAVRMGQRLFANNCAQCHGADARGSFGFPNLRDKDWLWGGSVEAIRTTITHGRQAAMPPWGAVLGNEGVDQVARHVLSLSGALPATASTEAGATQFNAICASCHGADGAGNAALGAPNLRDATWLYGGELEQVKHAIRSGRNGQMPAFAGQLDNDRLHLLTAYVYSLSMP